MHGLGYQDSSLSHFAATDVWLAGSTDPSEPAGWLGRGLTAAAGADADPLLGISIGGLTPSMSAPGFSPTSLPVGEEEMPWTPLDREDHLRSSAAMHTLTAPEPADSELAAAARAGQAAALAVGDRLGHIVDEQNAATERAFEELETSGADEEEIEAQLAVGTLTPQFDAVADLINAGLPTRAYHVLQGGYDTHEGQADSHPTLLGGLDASLAAFWNRLGPNADRVVVMTWSEFGRRPDFNGSGTDHGTASIGLVIGRAVQGGHYGEPTDLNRVDDEANWIPTVDFRRYLGGVAGSVLGVDPHAVATMDAAPITLIRPTRSRRDS